MSDWRHGKLKWLVLTLAIVASVAGCWWSHDPPGRDIAMDPDLRECPHDPTWVGWEPNDDVGLQPDIDDIVTEVTGGRHRVPEYNDCQRFIKVGTRDQPAYDSLFAIFAADLDSLDALAGRIPVEREVGVAAAVIWAEGTYEPLGILRGFNCLVMRRTRPPETPAQEVRERGVSIEARKMIQRGGASWAASVVRAVDEVDCSGVLEMGEPLFVRETHPEALSLPPIVRWGFDDEVWEQYIVIKCGRAVCYIGSDGFIARGSPGLPKPPDGSSDGRRRAHEVALWHDKQPLATLPTTTVGGDQPLTPTSVFGTVIPHEDLGSYDTLTFANTWIPVAEVMMSGNLPDYVTKRALGATSGDERNIVEACLVVGPGSCPGVPANVEETAKCEEADEHSRAKWRSRHINAQDPSDIKYFCIKRYPASPDIKEVPAAARWRWQAEDEVIWFRCDHGCCDEVG